MPSIGFTGIHRFGRFAKGGGELECHRNLQTESREIEQGESCSPRGRARARSPEPGGDGWPPVEIAGEGKVARRRELGGREKKQRLWLGSVGLGAVFLKREMGTPDSLQCLSGAHRTAHSSCPVNHRTAHRKKEFCARLPVHRTLHSAVSGAHRTVR
jgi:hypothetical protein